MAQIQNIYIDQGTTFSLSLAVNDQNGDLKDLTGYTVAAQTVSYTHLTLPTKA